MCGRYTMTSPDELLEEFGVGELPGDLIARYNIAPTQPAPVALVRQGTRNIEMLRWGLIPAWAKDASIASRLINARSETANEKPAFKRALAARRCLVCASGFYEWRRGGDRAPYYFTRPSGKPLAFGGLWERWRGPDGAVSTFSILTTEATGSVAEIHHRMPLIVARDDYARWLDPEIPTAGIEDLLGATAPTLDRREVSKRVNSVREEGPALIEPGPAQQSLF